MKSAGIISVVTAGAQFPDTRKKLRRSLGEYVEIYCSSDTLPVSSDEHEHQDDSDLSVSAEDSPPEDMVRTIIEWLSEMGYLERPAGNDYTEAEESEVLKRLEQLGYL
jgi:riboflavin synthase